MPKGTPTIQPAKTVEYETPRDLFDKLWDEVGGFDLDPFCRPHHYTAKTVARNGGMIYVPDEESAASAPGSYHVAQVRVDGLAQPWFGKVWMQPPYGPFLRKCIPYAVQQVECGNAELVMGLLPAKTEVQWFQRDVLGRLPPSDTDLAWAAGLIDGEGCIYIKRDAATEKTRHASDSFSLQLKVTMHRKEQAVLERLQSRFGGYLHPVSTTNGMSWYTNSIQAEQVIRQIRPYLRSKGHQADLAIEFRELGSAGSGRRRVPPELIAERRRLYLELQKAKTIPVVPDPVGRTVTTDVRFIGGRLSFGGSDGGPARVGNVIVVWRK